MNGNVIRTITIRGQSEGIDKLTADVNKLAAAQENVAVVSEQSAKRVLSLEDAWKRQTLRLDEAARAQANIARETKLADAALKEGLATQAQHAQRLDQINQRYTKTADATKVVTHQTGLARHELVNLGRQAQDVGVSLASGQSPFTVLVQQGTQIADVFATSGGSIRGFFSQAIEWGKGFLTSTTGIVTAVLAIGAGAVYAASQFIKSSTTIEQALEEQNRLMKIGYDLHSQRLLLLNNEIDLQAKLAAEMRKVADLVERRATTPTQVAGEMGEALTGMAPLSGHEKLVEAQQGLNAAIAQGQPGFAQFNSMISQIVTAEPGVKATINLLLKVGEVGVKIEEAAAATGRLRELTQQLAQIYPGITSDTAKQLQLLEAQLEVARAYTENERLIAQEKLRIIQLQQQGLKLEEAQLIAAKERQIAEANAETAEQRRAASAPSYSAASGPSYSYDLLGRQITKTAGSYDVLGRQITETAGSYDLLGRQITETAATDENAERQARSQREADRKRDRQQAKAAAEADQKRSDQQADAEEQHIAAVGRRNAQEAWALQMREEQETEAAAAAEAAASANKVAAYNANEFAAALERGRRSALWWAETMEEIIQGRLSMLNTQSEGKQYESTWDPLMMEQRKQTYTKLYGGYKETPQGTGLGSWSLVTPDFDQIRENLSALVTSNEDLTKSTDSLNATMQNALSPFYSQDPRTTKLGFRAGVTGNPDWMVPGASNENPLAAILGAGATAPGMANGGSFIVGGGYSANDNAMAMFPVASGEEVVVNRTPQGRGGQAINIDNRIIINGSVDDDALSKMKVSRYQQAQRMRAGLVQAS